MKYATCCFALLLLASLFPSKAQAHVLKTDGPIGAVLHVNPEDDPIVGQPTDFFFEIKDRNNKLQSSNCECVISIIQNGKQIYSQPLFQNAPNENLESASFTFTFPQKDIYTVILSGNPTGRGAFEPFRLSWDVRVARETTADASVANNSPAQSFATSHIPHLLGVGGIILFILVYLIVKNLQKKGNRKSPTSIQSPKETKTEGR